MHAEPAARNRYMPSLTESILLVEDDYESKPLTFDRDLQSLIHQPVFKGVKGIVIGKFSINRKWNPRSW